MIQLLFLETASHYYKPAAFNTRCLSKKKGIGKCCVGRLRLSKANFNYLTSSVTCPLKVFPIRVSDPGPHGSTKKFVFRIQGSLFKMLIQIQDL
jgi:hypothetical protein